MKKENWYFLIALVALVATMIWTIGIAADHPRVAYSFGFIMGVIVTKFFIFAAMDSKPEASATEQSEEELCCEARQYSDSMTCRCGNQWDVNDVRPPACNVPGLKASFGIAAHTAAIAQTVAKIRQG